MAKPDRWLTNTVVRHMLGHADKTNREWALAMAAEVDEIAADAEALLFALGCWRAVLFSQREWVIWASTGLGAMLIGWAGAKTYFALLIAGIAPMADSSIVPPWVVVWAGTAGTAYCVAGLAIVFSRWWVAMAALFAALVINGAGYGTSVLTDTELTLWLMAIAGEDYFIWTCAVLALGGLAWLRHGPERRMTV